MCQRRQNSMMLCAFSGEWKLRGRWMPNSPASRRHVRVAGEVEVDLKRVERGRAPGVGRRQHSAVGGRFEHLVDLQAEVVGEHHLLEQAEREQRQRGQQHGLHLAHRWRSLLARHFLLGDDRAGDHVREEEHEQRIALHRRRPVLAVVVAGDQEADLLDRVERDAERDRHVGRVAEQQVGVLQPGQKGDVEADAEQQQRAREPLVAGAHARHRHRDRVVDRHRGEQVRQVALVERAVEHERQHGQPAGRERGAAARLQRGEADPGDRDEQEDEFVAGEEHGAVSSAQARDAAQHAGEAAVAGVVEVAVVGGGAAERERIEAAADQRARLGRDAPRVGLDAAMWS